ncbi:TetR/AcrR family transcriptional regulator [Demequina capsici]|uniref:TetR/AcrR family transcriptional regulator n=1 Tax=Demequina capsici TaxID=3075620 RepID=A0AA96J8T4_9MICO|nr:TetR/AcrR family transcriptional regulator [Demequina sp. OYTSA14]WNM25725.1 TetR/AcrR family transcriptional regulator [Demequina sp. OYTSA14]
MATSEASRRGAAVRERILGAATTLFREQGIRAVSADRILADAGVAKVTFYRHFPTKDDLVVAYLEEELESARAVVASAEGLPREWRTQAFVKAMGEQMCLPGFRGCPFINAAAEYPDASHPVRAVVTRFRAWLIGEIAVQLAGLGVEDPGARAAEIMMVRDGAMVAGYLTGDPDGVTAALQRAVGAIVARAV